MKMKRNMKEVDRIVLQVRLNFDSNKSENS
ncbi:hypothetical protein PHOSAC3_121051 [Mesotoga infera]|nr:hypothetical protein PHOSAC3_121051 [Mesotoga infera]